MKHEKKMKIFLLALFVFSKTVNTHRILIANLVHSHGNCLPLVALGEELINKGHDVTFVLSTELPVLPEKAKQIIIPNVGDVTSVLRKSPSILDWKLYFQVSKSFLDSCDTVSSNGKLEEHLKNVQYDLTIVNSIMQQCILVTILHHQGNIPYIMYHPGFIEPTFLKRVSGISMPDWAFIPRAGIRDSTEMVAKNRFLNLFGSMLGLPFVYLNDYLMNRVLDRNLGTFHKDTFDVEKNASFLFSASNFEYDYPYPITPDVKMVGCMQCNDGNPLPQDFKEFITKFKNHGVIIFSIGSLLSYSDIDEEIYQIFINAFEQLPQGIIWQRKAKKEKLPKNIMVKSWLPLQDLLADQNTKLIISSGGYLTYQEAMYHGVPYLGYSHTGSLAKRDRNIILAQYKDVGLALNSTNITSQTILKQIKHILDDKKYKRNAKRISKLLRDKFMSPKEEAIYWIEYAIRNKDLTHFKSHARNLWFFQYYCLDIVLFSYIAVKIQTRVRKFAMKWIGKLISYALETLKRLASRPNDKKKVS